MNELANELVTDEGEYLCRLVSLNDARVIELGCGKAEMSRKLLERGLAASVTALEVDLKQHAANLASSHPSTLRFLLGGAEDIPLPDEQFDVAIMLKSLHHVPMPELGNALAEIRRVLVPGGSLYVSEPVYAGDFNDIVRLFHDEGEVRAAAYAALQRAAAAGVLEWVDERVFDTPLAFRNFDDFFDRMIRVTHSDISMDPATTAEVQRRFEKFMTPQGATFVRQMRVNLLRRAD